MGGIPGPFSRMRGALPSSLMAPPPVQGVYNHLAQPASMLSAPSAPQPFAAEYTQSALLSPIQPASSALQPTTPRGIAAQSQASAAADKTFAGLSPQAMQNIGMHSAAAGALVGVIGVIGQSIAGKENLKAQARTIQHEAFLANLNARAKEREVSAAKDQGRLNIAQVSSQAGQIKGKQDTNAAARGVVIREGSAGEVTATTDIAKEVEMLAINRSSIERSLAIGRQALSLRGGSLLDRISAGNLRRSASNIQPGISGGAQFISSMGQFAGQYANYRKSIN